MPICVSLPIEDEELTARDPAAGPPDEAELVIQDEGDIVFMEINETVAQEETKTTCMTERSAGYLKASQGAGSRQWTFQSYTHP